MGQIPYKIYSNFIMLRVSVIKCSSYKYMDSAISAKKKKKSNGILSIS